MACLVLGLFQVLECSGCKQISEKKNTCTISLCCSLRKGCDIKETD